MNTIDDDEIQKRLVILRRIHMRRREWFGEAISDQQMLRRREQGHSVLLFLAIMWLLHWGLKAWFDAETQTAPARIFSIFLVLCIAYLSISLYRTRKLLAVFEAVSPQNFEDLESALKATATEQAGTGQPATRPVNEPEGGDKPQPEAEGRSR